MTKEYNDNNNRDKYSVIIIRIIILVIREKNYLDTKNKRYNIKVRDIWDI